jgi:signal transduction histidine kinase
LTEDNDKDKQQVLDELAVMRRHVARLEALRVEHEETARALHERNRDLALLNRAGQTLTATLDPKEVIERMLSAVTETIGSQAGSVWLWDEKEPDWLVCQAAFDSGQDYTLLNHRLEPGQGIAGWVAQNATSAIAGRASSDPRFTTEVDQEIGFETTSLLAVPLQVRNRVIGVLEVVNKLEGEFDTDDLSVVETLAASAATALDNARLVAQLREQTRELQIRNEELDAFAHTVAHDLKSPTAIIIGFGEALEDNLDSLSFDELRRHLRTITRNGRRMNSIIKELLLMASVRKAQLEIDRVEMDDVMLEVLDRLSILIQDSGAEIILPESWPAAMGYAPWIEEIWVNYISNAIKYGGDPPRVELGAAVEDENQIRYWTRDNGPGLNPEEQERLFAAFTQLHPARVKGHGLGLSIVSRIVEKLGGSVGVESEPGHGSTFFFVLPGAD